MAIFGSLSDLPFPEIFNMIGRHNGRLVITDLPGDEIYELELAEGSLLSLRIEGQEVTDDLMVRDRLSGLMEASQGAFVFQRSTAEELHGALNLAITSLLMATASAVDEIHAYHERFAHPSTRFKRTGGAETWLDEDLYHFSERANPFLVRGTTAEELSRELHLSVEQVQLNLYKLRVVGWIAPLRAFEGEVPAAAPPEPGPGAAPPVFPATPLSNAPAAPAPAEEPPAEHHGRESLSSLLRTLRSRISLLWAQDGRAPNLKP